MPASARVHIPLTGLSLLLSTVRLYSAREHRRLADAGTSSGKASYRLGYNAPLRARGEISTHKSRQALPDSRKCDFGVSSERAANRAARSNATKESARIERDKKAEEIKISRQIDVAAQKKNLRCSI